MTRGVSNVSSPSGVALCGVVEATMLPGMTIMRRSIVAGKKCAVVKQARLLEVPAALQCIFAFVQRTKCFAVMQFHAGSPKFTLN